MRDIVGEDAHSAELCKTKALFGKKWHQQNFLFKLEFIAGCCVRTKLAGA
jgi:hypothetical protein